MDYIQNQVRYIKNKMSHIGKKNLKYLTYISCLFRESCPDHPVPNDELRD